MKRCYYVALTVVLTITCFIQVSSAQNGSFTNEEKAKVRKLFSDLDNLFNNKEKEDIQHMLMQHLFSNKEYIVDRFYELLEVGSIIIYKLPIENPHDVIDDLVKDGIIEDELSPKNWNDLKKLLRVIFDFMFMFKMDFTEEDRKLLNRVTDSFIDFAIKTSIENDIVLKPRTGLNTDKKPSESGEDNFGGLFKGVGNSFNAVRKMVNIIKSPQNSSENSTKTTKNDTNIIAPNNTNTTTNNDPMSNVPNILKSMADAHKNIVLNFQNGLLNLRKYLNPTRKRVPKTRKSAGDNDTPDVNAALRNIPEVIKTMRDFLLDTRNSIAYIKNIKVDENKLSDEDNILLQYISKMLETVANDTNNDITEPKARILNKSSEDFNKKNIDNDEISNRIKVLEDDFEDLFDDDQLPQRKSAGENEEPKQLTEEITVTEEPENIDIDQLLEQESPDKLPQRKNADISTALDKPPEIIEAETDQLPQKESIETDDVTEQLPEIKSTTEISELSKRIGIITDKYPEIKNAETDDVTEQLPETKTDIPEAITDKIDVENESNEKTDSSDEKPAARIKIPPPSIYSSSITIPKPAYNLPYALAHCLQNHGHEVDELLNGHNELNPIGGFNLPGSLGLGIGSSHIGLRHAASRPPFGLFGGIYRPPFIAPIDHLPMGLRHIFKPPFIPSISHPDMYIPADVTVPDKFIPSINPQHGFISPDIDSNFINSNDNFGESSAIIPQIPPNIAITTPLVNSLSKKIGGRNDENPALHPISVNEQNSYRRYLPQSTITTVDNIIPIEEYYGSSRSDLPRIIILQSEHPTRKEKTLPFLLHSFLINFYINSSDDDDKYDIDAAIQRKLQNEPFEKSINNDKDPVDNIINIALRQNIAPISSEVKTENGSKTESQNLDVPLQNDTKIMDTDDNIALRRNTENDTAQKSIENDNKNDGKSNDTVLYIVLDEPIKDTVTQKNIDNKNDIKQDDTSSNNALEQNTQDSQKLGDNINKNDIENEDDETPSKNTNENKNKNTVNQYDNTTDKNDINITDSVPNNTDVDNGDRNDKKTIDSFNGFKPLRKSNNTAENEDQLIDPLNGIKPLQKSNDNTTENEDQLIDSPNDIKPVRKRNDKTAENEDQLIDPLNGIKPLQKSKDNTTENEDQLIDSPNDIKPLRKRIDKTAENEDQLIDSSNGIEPLQRSKDNTTENEDQLINLPNSIKSLQNSNDKTAENEDQIIDSSNGIEPLQRSNNNIAENEDQFIDPLNGIKPLRKSKDNTTENEDQLTDSLHGIESLQKSNDKTAENEDQLIDPLNGTKPLRKSKNNTTENEDQLIDSSNGIEPLQRSNNNTAENEDQLIDPHNGIKPLRKSKDNTTENEDQLTDSLNGKKPLKNRNNKTPENEDQLIDPVNGIKPLRKSKDNTAENEDQLIDTLNDIKPLQNRNNKTAENEDQLIDPLNGIKPLKNRNNKTPENEDQLIDPLNGIKPLRKSKDNTAENEDQLIDALNDIKPQQKSKDNTAENEDKLVEFESEAPPENTADDIKKTDNKDLESGEFQQNIEHSTVPSTYDTKIKFRRIEPLEKSSSTNEQESQLFAPVIDPSSSIYKGKTKLIIIQPKEVEDQNLPYLLKLFLSDHRQKQTTRRLSDNEKIVTKVTISNNEGGQPGTTVAVNEKVTEAMPVDPIPRININLLPKQRNQLNTRRNNTNTNFNVIVNDLGTIDVSNGNIDNNIVKQIVQDFAKKKVKTLPVLNFGKSTSTRKLVKPDETKYLINKDFNEKEESSPEAIDFNRRSLFKESTVRDHAGQKVTVLPFASIVSTVGAVTDLLPPNSKNPNQDSINKLEKEHMKMHSEVIDNMFSTLSHMTNNKPTTISGFETKLPNGMDSNTIVSGSRSTHSGVANRRTKKIRYPRILLIQPEDVDSSEDLHVLLRRFIDKYYQNINKKNVKNKQDDRNAVNVNVNSNTNDGKSSMRRSISGSNHDNNNNENININTDDNKQMQLSSPDLEIFDLRDK